MGFSQNRTLRPTECENFFLEFEGRILRLIENIDLLDSNSKRIRRESRVLIGKLVSAIDQTDIFLIDKCGVYLVLDFDQYWMPIKAACELENFSEAKKLAQTFHSQILFEKPATYDRRLIS